MKHSKKFTKRTFTETITLAPGDHFMVSGGELHSDVPTFTEVLWKGPQMQEFYTLYSFYTHPHGYLIERFALMTCTFQGPGTIVLKSKSRKTGKMKLDGGMTFMDMTTETLYGKNLLPRYF